MSESTEVQELREALNAATRLAIAKAREDLLAFILLMDSTFSVGPHHRIICDELMALEATPDQRLMIFLAPRSSKSLIASIYFPAWSLGRRKYLQWIQASHSEDLAAKFGRAVRDLISTPQYRLVFPDVELSKQSRAALDWQTQDGRRSFYGAGTSTKLAGHGFDIGSIDDPISEQDAYSDAKREEVNRWYPGGMRSRRQPGASVVITMCLTGDTSIHMADGTFKNLREIKVGDCVMSWDAGKLTGKPVEGWSNQGLDEIYQIKTGNHSIKANARHPFLVQRNSGTEWVRVSDLRKGDSLVGLGLPRYLPTSNLLTEKEAWLLGYMFGDGWLTYRDNYNTDKKGCRHPRRAIITCWAHGANKNLEGKVYALFQEIFSHPLKRTKFGYYRTEKQRIGRWFAEHGLIGKAKTKRLPEYLFREPTAIRQAFLSGFLAADGYINADSLRTQINLCNRNLVLDVRNLAGSLGYKTTNIYGQAYIAQAPNSPNPIVAYQHSCAWQANYKHVEEFVTTKIRKITKVEPEEVFDLQIADTENFIANGLVTHNTRWHWRDPAGFLLETSQKNPQADQWRMVEIPAVNTVESAIRLNIARQKLIDQGYLTEDYPIMIPYESDKVVCEGMSYWPAPSVGKEFCWSIKELLATKANMPPYQWDALYMQRPTAVEGSIFKTEYWQDWNPMWSDQVDMTIFSIDTAYSVNSRSAQSAITYWGLWRPEGTDDDSDFNIVLLGAWRGHWDYAELKTFLREKYVKYRPDVLLIEKKASGQSLISELRLEGYPIAEYNPDRDKIARAHAALPSFYAKKVFTDSSKKWAQEVMEECRKFPSGYYKDYPDTVSQAVIWFRQTGWLQLKTDGGGWTSYEEDAKIMRRKKAYY